ncbi:MAG: aspartate aminotransferase family protein [Acidimicrobiaceae bacterium]|nr:aspartate aminotransferase family protein [Acidimicrobiaceae bacterium]
MTTSQSELLSRHRRVMPSWLSLYYNEPLELVSGEGRHVRDSNGKNYLDFFGGILTTSTGYNVPEVVDAIREQAGRMLHTSTLYLIRPMIELAERISDLSTIPDAKVFLVNSGTEAVETALMISCAARSSNQVLALRNSYHGRSFTAMSVTGNRSWSSSSLSPLNVSYVQSGNRLRSPFGPLSDREFIDACVRDLRDVIETTTSGDVACMIAEPIQGVGGFIVPPDGFFGAMKKVLDEYGILFISDEVQTGWGRTGEHFWGFEAHDIQPDLLTFAKGLGNGLAIGGVVGRPELVDSVRANSISTFGGNPLSSAGALANLNYILSHDLQSNALKVGNYLRDQLQERAGALDVIGEIRGRGLMIGVELVEPGSLTPNLLAAQSVLEACRRGGVLIGKGGLHNNVLRIAPPMSVTMDEATTFLEVLTEALHDANHAVTGHTAEMRIHA